MLYTISHFSCCSQFGNTYIDDVRIIARSTLRSFWEARRDSEGALKAWFQEAKQAKWTNPNEIKAVYHNASILKNNRVVFNIAGNRYRLVVRINYKIGIAWIRFAGTHEEYDKINAEEV